MTEPTTPLQPITHATVRTFVDEVRSAPGSCEVLGLTGSAGPYLAAELLSEIADPLVVLTPTQRQAQTFAADLAFFHGRADQIFFFPHWEVGPFEPLSPHPGLEAVRLTTLGALQDGRAKAVVLPVRALMQRIIPGRILSDLKLHLKTEIEYDRGALLQSLVNLGYDSTALVEDRGSFSVRGDILDIFPASLEFPVRLEFFGDFIERIREFDPVSQRTGHNVLDELTLLPAREILLTGEHLETFCSRLKERCDALGFTRPQREMVLEELREGILAPGRAFLLPYNYAELNTFFDYAEKSRWVIVDPPEVEQEADRFASEIRAGEERIAGKSEPFAPASQLYLSPGQIETELAMRPRVDFSPLQIYRLDQERLQFRFHVEGNGDIREGLKKEGGGIRHLVARLQDWKDQNWRVLLVCHQQGQAERLLDLFEPYGERPDLLPEGSWKNIKAGQDLLSLGELSAGFRLPDERLAVITEEEIFGQRVRRRGLKEARAQALLSSLAELKEGDFVVHADHGIGIYRGLLHLQTGPVEGDFLHLEYQEGDKLYLPVDRIEKVQKYVGGEGHRPRLDKMGGGAWEKAKLRVRAAVEELARDLLQIYARRQMAEGFRYSPPDQLFREFEASFPFEETPDQQAAIDEVLSDMTGDRPVDRLVCGDVGYGKTEVAIRAAYKAVLDGRQVAVLVPTTVLARQHLQTFSERLADSPVSVDMVSRFRTPAQQKEILKRTAAGRVDILIGTHRLLQRDVKFKDLGLIIVDEEQRFGVTHKERLKKLRAEVDVITLTATPIPRTLHMSMMGMRDLSVIDTPPVDRLAIRTYVTRFDDDLVREAILRELRRGGQVFFVHNRVQTIGAKAEFLRRLVPEAKIAVAHGQMGEGELEKVMLDFVSGETNVLASTTIIENGLDIPRANTIIIDRADCFGLAQLYQLRGRVGRSRNRAYAYLLIPGEGTLTREARERLRILQELTELGGGFRIASHDLELRGAGDLLGARQAGQIAAVGFEMYAELLEETIQELQGRIREDRVDPEIRLGLSAYLPEKYIPDPNQRLVLYKKLAGADTEQELYDIVDELRDRYGESPPPTVLLLEMMKLRVSMKRLKVESAEFDGRNLIFGFHKATPVPPEKILSLLKKAPDTYRFSPDYRLTIRLGRLNGEQALEAAKKELHGLF